MPDSQDLALLYTILLGFSIAVTYIIVLLIVARLQQYFSNRKWRNIFAKLDINEIERINRRN